ncbi:MAG TPA: hypothetical protein VFL56_02935 [Solirubrobacterales bacterium]|nr:hypothetical protein [Solirubrobacterales bacterium]
MTSSRERKRAERRKRKRRSTERAAAPGSGRATAEGTPTAVPEESFPERMARRSEERNVAARAKLKPLDRGERPTAVTVAAVISVLLAVAITIQGVLAAAGVDAAGADTNPAPLFLFAVILWVMTYGLWKARYWAVLGFQTLLLLMLLASALGLVLVSTVLQALGTTALILGSGALFYFLIRAMARIQMPRPPGAE